MPPEKEEDYVLIGGPSDDGDHVEGRAEQLEEYARALRRACKSKFFKQVEVQAVADVVADARAAGFDPADFVNLVSVHLHPTMSDAQS